MWFYVSKTCELIGQIEICASRDLDALTRFNSTPFGLVRTRSRKLTLNFPIQASWLQQNIFQHQPVQSILSCPKEPHTGRLLPKESFLPRILSLIHFYVYSKRLTAASPREEGLNSSLAMDGFQLPEETAEDRVRAATEFLDPSECWLNFLVKIGDCIWLLTIVMFHSRYPCSEVRFRRNRIIMCWSFICWPPSRHSYRADIVLMLNRGLRRLIVSKSEVGNKRSKLGDLTAACRLASMR